MMLIGCLRWMSSSGCLGIGPGGGVSRAPFGAWVVVLRFRAWVLVAGCVLLQLQVYPSGLFLAHRCYCVLSAGCFPCELFAGLPSCCLLLSRVQPGCSLGAFLWGLPSRYSLLWARYLCPSCCSLCWLYCLLRLPMAPVVRYAFLSPVPMSSVVCFVHQLIGHQSVVGLLGSSICCLGDFPMVGVAAYGLVVC